ncbi:MAGE-domain-containing protein [Rhizoclosmatium globosum]|uniref:MAGE-domain-containing protein n=1 Tax=Rhizoclosmatium globosum TaxID=329046 RepID=A0A1Y2BDW1_9FUNG|nr:MAGE-domain-containing protein [Rhizoclosmatium globosum]|eukprot:ORY33002.1 MAGE-domain-containing protein [Rhizoclosmatium globosum]
MLHNLNKMSEKEALRNECRPKSSEPEPTTRATEHPKRSAITTGKALEAANNHFRRLKKRDSDRFVKAFVRIALASQQKRVPVKREDLVKTVLSQQNAKVFAAVFDRAQKVLRSVFALELVRLDSKHSNRRKDPKAKAQKEPTVRQEYILRSILPKHHQDFVASIIPVDDDKTAKILSCELFSAWCLLRSVWFRLFNQTIHNLTQSQIDLLYKHLETLGIYRNRTHPVFQKIEDVIASFVKEEYLDKLKNDETAQQQNAGSAEDYQWGPRAKVEFSEEEISVFVAKMFPVAETESVKAILSQKI